MLVQTQLRYLDADSGARLATRLALWSSPPDSSRRSQPRLAEVLGLHQHGASSHVDESRVTSKEPHDQVEPGSCGVSSATSSSLLRAEPQAVGPQGFP